MKPSGAQVMGDAPNDSAVSRIIARLDAIEKHTAALAAVLATEVEARLKLARNVEATRVDLADQTEAVRVDLAGETEDTRADLADETEAARADLASETEDVRAELAIGVEETRAVLAVETETARVTLATEATEARHVMDRLLSDKLFRTRWRALAFGVTFFASGFAACALMGS